MGWWEGELNGRRGVFPDNFVKLLPPDFEKEGNVSLCCSALSTPPAVRVAASMMGWGRGVRTSVAEEPRHFSLMDRLPHT